jgi:hypothetical protein
MFKEMNILSAHRSSNPICPAMESVSIATVGGIDLKFEIDGGHRAGVRRALH